MRSASGRVWAMLAMAAAWSAAWVEVPAAVAGQGGAQVPAERAALSVAEAVPVRAVTLFSSGVGYFEHFGTVAGSRVAELRFRTEQINDILKSLVLQDLDGGRIAAVNYASQEPLDRKLRSFQVDVSGNPSLADLLGQLRGAKIQLRVEDREITGTILGVEVKQVGQNETVVQRHVISVLSGGTVRTAVIEDLREATLLDARLQDELTRALEALAGARDQERKSVELRFVGEGERRVRVGYVVETPVWKTSYRLLLTETPSIQGWAVVENQTDTDWNDVQLSLVSGRPISFVQDLYTPLFVPRPVVVPELFAGLRPPQYAAGGAVAERAKAQGELSEERRAAPMALAAAPPPPGRRAEGAGFAGGGREVQDAGPIDPAASVQAMASAASLGELFQYTVGSVTLPRQTSAMIPIVTDPIAAERVSIYNPSVLPRNPLTGAVLRNTTGKHLLAGPVTVFDRGSYAGDAQLDNLPPGQSRLISFGVDLQVIIDGGRDETRQEVQTASISRGVMNVQRKVVASRSYSIDNKSDRERVIVIEHPRRRGTWKLSDGLTPFEQTDTLYRFRETVPANASKVVTVREETVTSEAVALLNVDLDELLRFSQLGPIPPGVREALQRAAELHRDVVAVERGIAAVQQQLSELTAEQNRIRDNYRAVQQDTDYARRLLAKLNEQETQIEALQKQLADLRTQLDGRRKALADYLGSLELR
ncbi:MAG: hypothetical protein ACK4PI_02830 [Tepidisphaerales bacterium]